MNDERITHYALGELHGPDREAFERELAQSPDLQQALQQTTAMSQLLSNLPKETEHLPDLDALKQRCAENLRAAERTRKIRKFILVCGGLAAAACLIFSLSIPVLRDRQEKISSVRVAATKVAQPSPEATPPAQVEAPLVAVAEPKDLPEARLSEMAGNGVTETAQAPVAVTTSPTAPAEPATAKISITGDIPLAGRLFASVADKAGADGSVATKGSASTSSGNLSGGASRNGLREAEAIGAYAKNRSTATLGVDQKMAYRIQAFSDADVVPVPGTRQAGGFNTEAYDAIAENPFLEVRSNPLSTFSIDVDTASYANIRRFLQAGQLPPPGAVRIEEMLNYFPYTYPQPEDGRPFSVTTEVGRAPWDTKHLLARIGLRGRELPAGERPASNLVFLIDVSGSMNEPNKLPLLKRCLDKLVDQLGPKDRVSIVVYAGQSGLVLPATPGNDKARIHQAIDSLGAGGSTNGAGGIRRAYETARENFIKEGSNRVILCTDGDFNVGTTNQSQLVKLIEKERTSGVFLSVLGFGTGNLKDSTMQKLADKGNGNYAYIDSLSEGRKVLVEQMGGTLFTIAKDVKIQVEFNPAQVAGYRLIGYEKRLLAKEDFNDDRKDAGEIGAGHTVTALYEVVPAGQALAGLLGVDPLKYQTPPSNPSDPKGELLTVKLRYKAPDGDTSKLIEVPVAASVGETSSTDFKFASAVAAFGMALRDLPQRSDLSWDQIQKLAREGLGEDPGAYRAEFLTLIEKAKQLKADRHSERD